MAAGYPVKVNYLTGDVLTAANLNDLAGTVNLYDPTAKGDLFPATAADAVARLAVGANNTVLTADSTTATGMKWAAAGAAGTPANGQSQVLTSQSTTSASYVGLTTAQVVSVVTGTRALVILSALVSTPSPASTARCRMGFEISGATTVAASNDYALTIQGDNTNPYHDIGVSNSFIVTGLTAGTNTFTAQFSVNLGSAGIWEDRRIAIIDMGS